MRCANCEDFTQKVDIYINLELIFESNVCSDCRNDLSRARKLFKTNMEDYTNPNKHDEAGISVYDDTQKTRIAKVKSIQGIFASIPLAIMYILAILLLARINVHLLCKF